MGEFDHVPTPDADELRQMFEADGGAAAQSIEDLHEAAARDAMAEAAEDGSVQRAREVLSQPATPADVAHADQEAAARREAARAGVAEAARQAASPDQRHLRDMRVHREITAQADVQEAPVRSGAYHTGESRPHGDTLVAPAPQKAPAPEDRDKVLREIFKKQIPSAWTPQGKKYDAKRKAEAQDRIENDIRNIIAPQSTPPAPKEPLHRRAARFIGSKFKRGRHSR